MISFDLRPIFAQPSARPTAVPERIFKAILACDEDALIAAVLAGEPVNGHGPFELTPLHVACRAFGVQAAHAIKAAPAQERMIRILLSLGADATAYDKSGHLPSAWCEGHLPPCLREHMMKLTAEGKTWPERNPDMHYEAHEVRSPPKRRAQPQQLAA